MKLISPSYYKKFKCIADKCKHSCCIGWEIDVDEKTDKYYKTVGGELGERLSRDIDRSTEPSHFRLSTGERCPFLNKNGLCDIISELGEGALCQICADHPRYRNFYSDRTEIGLGLCCEAAAELILKTEEKVTLIVLSDDGDDDETDTEDEIFYGVRDKIFSIVQDRNKSIKDRMEDLLCEFGLSMPKRSLSEWARDFLTLEMLDSEWGTMLEKLKKYDNQPQYENDVECEQLLVYFIYRHLADGLYDGRLHERIKLAILSLDMILSISAACKVPLTDVARAYSSEIEYSEENIEALLELL